MSWRKTPAVMSAVAALALVSPTHAHAAPCTHWVLKSPALNMNLSNGQTASFDWNQELGTQSARDGMQPNAKLQAPDGDSWDGYASLGIQGGMIAGPVSWHPRQGDFGGTPVTEMVINSTFTGNIADPGSARGSAHDNKGATVDWVGASIFDCADAS